jgi:transposase
MNMPYIQGEDRYQFTLTPMCLDDYIEPDSICRVIAAYVNSLDMIALGFKYAQTKDTGRPPHDPASMLMLYLYGYLNRIRSSRRLEAETHRNVEVMWLMEKLTPDDKTISEFRRNNADALKAVFRAFSIWCAEQGLYGKELVAVDGTKIRANSSRKNIHTQSLTSKQLEEVEKKISEYMAVLEKNDAEGELECELSAEAVRAALVRLNEKKSELEGYLQQIEKNDGVEVSTVDPDCRLMKQGGDGRNLDACYNVQTIVDEKHKLIVDFEVTNCPDDKGGLVVMTESAKEIMGIQEVVALGDKGYYDGEDISKCEANGTTCLASKMLSGRNTPNPLYNQENFRYDKERDCYICPREQLIPYRSTKTRKGAKGRVVEVKVYRDSSICKNCPMHQECTKEKYGRTLTRSPWQDTLDIVDARLQMPACRELLSKRSQIVEHPFGTTKRGWGFRDYLCRGKRLVTGEQSMVFLAYNFRRVVNILKGNSKDLMAAFS